MNISHWPWYAVMLLVVILTAVEIAAFQYFFDLELIEAAVVYCVTFNIIHTITKAKG